MSRDFVKPVTSAKLDTASNSKSVTLIVTSRDRPSHSRGDRYTSDSWSFRYCSCRYSAASRSTLASRLTTFWNRGIGSTARQIPSCATPQGTRKIHFSVTRIIALVQISPTRGCHTTSTITMGLWDRCNFFLLQPPPCSAANHSVGVHPLWDLFPDRRDIEIGLKRKQLWF